MKLFLVVLFVGYCIPISRITWLRNTEVEQRGKIIKLIIYLQLYNAESSLAASLKKLDAKLERPSEFGEIMEDSEESAEVFQRR